MNPIYRYISSEVLNCFKQFTHSVVEGADLDKYFVPFVVLNFTQQLFFLLHQCLHQFIELYIRGQALRMFTETFPHLETLFKEIPGCLRMLQLYLRLVRGVDYVCPDHAEDDLIFEQGILVHVGMPR